MSRTPLPFHADDLSALAKSLTGQLAACDHTPGHVEMLNMLARSGGFRNFQHLRAQAVAQARLEQPPPAAVPAPTVDLVRVGRLLRYFDDAGRLTRWPGKRHQQEWCLWVVWSAIPPRTSFTEPEINRRLTAVHLFGDYALLRRWLCDYGMMTRTADGRDYRRVERSPPPEALALIRALRARASAPAPA